MRIHDAADAAIGACTPEHGPVRRRMCAPGAGRGRPPLAAGLALVVTALCLVPVAWSAAPARAYKPTAAAWEPTGLTEAVRELYTPASGAFFARTDTGLLRSNDAGATWAPVALPPPAERGGPRVAVDPTNHTVLYASGAAGLYQTRDDAATWQVILPLAASAASPGPVQAIAVSAADPSLVYVLVLLNGLELRRSRDGGATWDAFSMGPAGSPCTWNVMLLQAHPSEAQRVFRTAGCYAGRNLGDGLWESADQGATWAQIYREVGTFARRLVGGQGVEPRRFYLAANAAMEGARSRLARSDDDGHTWHELGGLAIAGSKAIDGLAYDPAAPDRVYVSVAGADVQVSEDGGATWTSLGTPGQSQVDDLAVGIDGRLLFSATDHGVWRLPLDR